MYVPPHFRDDDPESIQRVIRESRLASFVTSTAADGIIATPLPFIFDPDEGEHGTLYGHLARANPQATAPALGEALEIFMGPDAYVSPGWYPAKQEHGKVVPTWNYVAVHAYGNAEFFDDPARLLHVVSRLTNLHEAGRTEPWTVTDAPEQFIAGQLKATVGIRMPLSRVHGKLKMSQNRSDADRLGVVKGLNESDRTADHSVARLIPWSRGRVSA